MSDRDFEQTAVTREEVPAALTTGAVKVTAPRTETKKPFRPGVRRSGVALLLLVAFASAGFWVASQLGYVKKVQQRLFPRSVDSARLSSGDFPAGVSAPVGEFAAVPLRPTLIGFTPRGSSAALLLATGGAQGPNGEPPKDGLFKTAYALDAQALLFAKEEELRRALAFGAEHGGVDMAAISVDRLAHWTSWLRDARPRTVLLLGRSRGQEAMAAVGVGSLAELKGKRIGVYRQSSAYYFALWALSRVALTIHDVTWVDLGSTYDAGKALREGRADAVVGLVGDVELAARDRGGTILASTLDAPHLIANVLVVRGEFAARYPDAVRRVIRGVLDAGANVTRDPAGGARMLSEIAPYLGDPYEAIKGAPPATLKDNLSFFGLSGEAPVTYDELFKSASELAVKIGQSSAVLDAEDTRDLGPLKYVSQARGP